MSYIQIDIGGKPRGLKFNQGAFLWMQGKMLSMDSEDAKAYGAYILVYSGLKGNAIVKCEEVDFTFEQVSEWVDGLNDDVLLQVMAVFNETQKFKELLPKDTGNETDKKKDKKTTQSVL